MGFGADVAFRLLFHLHQQEAAQTGPGVPRVHILQVLRVTQGPPRRIPMRPWPPFTVRWAVWGQPSNCASRSTTVKVSSRAARSIGWFAMTVQYMCLYQSRSVNRILPTLPTAGWLVIPEGLFIGGHAIN